MTTIIKAPEYVEFPENSLKIFLAGSIDMGSAVDWQKRFENEISNYPDVFLLNPRRDDWDSSWVQDISDPQFNEQVTWELEYLERVDLIVFYFDHNGKAPITLLELWLFGHHRRALVCCPEGYWRKGNVQIVCDRYNIPLFDSLDDLIFNTNKWLLNRI